MVDVEKIVREYMDKTVHMSLATVSGSKPWVCEVHFAYDNSLSLYFVSLQSTRHSQEIAANPNVAGNIVRQHELTELPNGIYFEGTAEVIKTTPEDIERYCNRLGRDAAQLTEQLAVPGERSMYKITPQNWAAFGKFDGETLEKYGLDWSKHES